VIIGYEGLGTLSPAEAYAHVSALLRSGRGGSLPTSCGPVPIAIYVDIRSPREGGYYPAHATASARIEWTIPGTRSPLSLPLRVPMGPPPWAAQRARLGRPYLAEGQIGPAAYTIVLSLQRCLATPQSRGDRSRATVPPLWEMRR
jgi:hypothetical protein